MAGFAVSGSWRIIPLAYARRMALGHRNERSELAYAWDERRRAKGFNNTAAGPQFSVGRTVLRMILSKMLNCDPGVVELNTMSDDHLLVTVSHENRTIMFAVSYVGIWVVIAASAGRVGIGLVKGRVFAAGGWGVRHRASTRS
jgi:phosphopantetheinyl transferase